MKKLLITLGVLAVFLPASAAANGEAMRTLCQWAQRFAASEQAITTCGNVGVTLSPKPLSAAELAQAEHDALVQKAQELRAAANDAYAAYIEANRARQEANEKLKDADAVKDGSGDKRIKGLEKKKQDAEQGLTGVEEEMAYWAGVGEEYKDNVNNKKTLADIEKKLLEDPTNEKLLKEKAALESKIAANQAKIDEAVAKAAEKDPKGYNDRQEKMQVVQNDINSYNERISGITDMMDMSKEELAAEYASRESQAKAAESAYKDAKKALEEADKAAQEAEAAAGI